MPRSELQLPQSLGKLQGSMSSHLGKQKRRRQTVLCRLCLLWGAIALFRGSRRRWVTALIANLVALGAVFLGMAALAIGAGPRTARNDLYHRMMLILIAAVILILLFGRARLSQG